MAGVIPGLMFATMLGVTTLYRAWKNDYPRMPRSTWSERIKAFRDSIWGLPPIFIVLGGIYAGLVHPHRGRRHERGLCLRGRGLRLQGLKLCDVPQGAARLSQHERDDLYIITNAVLFSFLMSSEQIPQDMTSWIAGSGMTWIEFLLIVNIILLLAGNVMEPTSIVLITAPILFPIAAKLGIHPVHSPVVAADPGTPTAAPPGDRVSPGPAVR